MFNPKTFFDLFMAMKTRANVEINGYLGIITGLRIDSHKVGWKVTLCGTAIDEVETDFYEA